MNTNNIIKTWTYYKTYVSEEESEHSFYAEIEPNGKFTLVGVVFGVQDKAKIQTIRKYVYEYECHL